jgi:hypothetical protein
MYSVFVKPPLEVTLLENVIVGHPRGILVDPQGQLIIDQLDEVLAWTPRYYGRDIRDGSTLAREKERRIAMLTAEAADLHARRDALRRLGSDADHVYMVHPFGHIAFGHLFDSLQRLYPVLPVVPRPFRVLHSNSRQIVGFETHMRLLGVAAEQLLTLRESVVVPRLWISPWQCFPAGLTSQTFDWIYRRYTENLRARAPTRLYLSRNHVRPGARSVLNEGEVLDFLQQHGFIVVRGTEPLEEILGLFNAAKVIVGPHGSLFANTMFCAADCRILEYCPANRVDRSFLTKRKLTSSYKQILIEADESFNITIPLDGLRQLVSELEGA